MTRVTVVVAVVTLLLLTKAASNIPRIRIPSNPCPDIFQYRFNGTHWYGTINLEVPTNFRQVLHLEVILSVRGKLPNNYLGEIEFANRRRYRYQVYKISFPLGSLFLPKVTQIVVNKRLLCQGPPYHAPVTTFIQLEYTSNRTFLPLSVSELPSQHHHDRNLYSASNICGQVNPAEIKDGGIVQKHTWPWIAALYVRNLTSLSYHCCGNLVSSKIVVSAAHCFRTSKVYHPKEILVMLGKHSLNQWTEKGSVSVACEEISIHPDFDDTLQSYDADIALIFLENSVVFTDYIRPICLWSGSSELNDIVGQQGTTIGWGQDQKMQPSRILKSVPMTIVSHSECYRSNEDFKVYLSNRTFCAVQRMGSGLCNGDSGSSFMVYRNNRWLLRGVVSASLPHSVTVDEKHCNLGRVVIYADVAKFLPWIYSFLLSEGGGTAVEYIKHG